MLRKINLAEIDEKYKPTMSLEELREELKKPRSERKGLSPMPPDMSCTGADAERMTHSLIAQHKANAAAKARAFANAQNSNVI